MGAGVTNHWTEVDWTGLASYPGHVFGGKSGLVSTVCACASDSGNWGPGNKAKSANTVSKTHYALETMLITPS